MPEQHPFPDEFSPIGSSVFYAIRFAPSGIRSPLSLANAFYRTLRNIPVTCSDPGVAAEKLNWWRQEIKRSLQAEAQHPIAISMGELQTRYSLPGDYFEPLFEAIGKEIGAVLIENDIELEYHCRHTGALFADLITLIGGANEEQRRSARKLGSFQRMVEIIRDLGIDLRRNRCFVPSHRLQTYRLNPMQLLQIEDEDQLRPPLSAITTIQQQLYNQTLDEISARNGLGPVLSMAAMAERVLSLIHADSYRRLLHQRTSLTPLLKLWISWRCQRSIR